MNDLALHFDDEEDDGDEPPIPDDVLDSLEAPVFDPVTPADLSSGRGPLPHPAACAACPFAVNGKPAQPVRGEGPPDADWIVVGEGPGVQETKALRPFVGPSGRMLDNAFASAKASRSRVFTTNATNCIPTRNATDGQKKQARKCCESRLRSEL